MSRTLRLALLAALFALAVPATVVARPLGLPETLTTAHFQIHYTGDPIFEDSIVHQQAGDLAAHAERAYTTFVNQWGYPAPMNDGDGRTDIYVVDTKPALGFAIAETPANQSYGYILLDASSVGMPETIAHELFHLVQYRIWAPMDAWLAEGTAEWAGFRFLDFPTNVGAFSLLDTLGAPDMSLSCSGAACGLSDYERGGYSRWHFYQYLTERWGANAVKDVFTKAQALNDVTLTGTDFLTASLADKGSTLNDAFTDWTVANMTGSYQAVGLRGLQPAPYSTTTTGGANGALPAQKIAVNHLASRYVAFERGDGAGAGACYAATLTVHVTLPSGVGSRPYFYWTAPGSSPVPLAVSGSNATLSVPWDTCTWTYRGLLALPNPSVSIDAAEFIVSGSITVDKTRIATAKPPVPGPYTGPTIPAPLVDEAPSIALYGPEVLRVASKTRVLRLVIFSSGPGQLNAEIGGVELGTRALRTGNNDLRFTVPRSMLRTLSARSSLTLTSLSPSGHVGATLTRTIRLSK